MSKNGKFTGVARIAILAGLIGIIIGAVIATTIVLAPEEETEEAVAMPARSFAGTTIVLDAGHGGFDIGTTGINGTIESDLNLAITQKLEALLISEGANVVMTRSDAEAVGEDKDSDMAYRRNVIETSGQAVTVSIHQNHFDDPAVRGPQVFFSPGSVEGEKLASAIQDELNSALAPPEPRSINAVGYYIVQSGIAPAVIVECGFLSNAEEEALLITDEYQDALADAVAQGIYDYMETLA